MVTNSLHFSCLFKKNIFIIHIQQTEIQLSKPIKIRLIQNDLVDSLESIFRDGIFVTVIWCAMTHNPFQGWHLFFM